MNKEIMRSEEEFPKDTVLIKSFLTGDEGAFDKLVLRYQDKVINICYRLLGNFQEANDSAQDTFIKVYRSLKKFRFESAFSTWLYRIAVNGCKNKLRSLSYRYGRKMVRLDDPVETDEGSYFIEVGDESFSPRRKLERKERDMLIQQAIDSLPEDQKMVIVLRDIEGLSYEEVEDVTGYKLGTVKSKLARSRKRLRKKLKGIV